jgi:3-oxoacyl-[acyl-carrier protein] reductase
MTHPVVQGAGTVGIMEGTPGEVVALVSGGTGAIGSSICRLLGESGYRVAFTYHSDERARDQVLASLRSAGVTALAQALDLTDAGAVRQFADRTSSELGPITALIHASGPTVPQRFVGQVDETLLSRHLDHEIIGFFNLVRATIAQLRESRGSITAVTTVATKRFIRRDGLSSVPKAAVESMVRALATEEGRFGVRANCVGPGILSEGMAQDLISAGEFDEQSQQQALQRIALGRFGSALDVAQLVCFLASDRASYITGQTIDVDGGYSL